jgi:hypothetical protein
VTRPPGLKSLTPDWFTRVLRRSGTLGPAANVTSVVAHGIGTGQLSSVTRVALEYDRDTGAPASLVVKTPSPDAGSRRVGATMGIYRSEVRFYQEVAPSIGLPTPTLHWSELDERTGDFVLVLDDLYPVTHAGDMLSHATTEQVSSAIGGLVGMQAPTWDDARLRRLPWLSGLGGMRALFAAVPAAIDGFERRFGERLEAQHMNLIRGLVPRTSEAFDAIWRPPFVIAHGDYRLDNMLFGTEPPAPALTVVDWQTVCLGPPGLDVAVFLASSVDTGTRRSTERDLLKSYVDGLAQAGVRGFGYDQAWESYRRASLSPLLLSVFTSVALERTERGDAMWLQLLRGAAQLVADTEAARVLD